MIKVKMLDILNAVPAFKELAKQPLYGKYSLKIARMIKKLDAENAIYQEEIRKIALKYGDKTEDGQVVTNEKGYITFSGESYAAFEKEQKDLLSAEIDLDSEPIKAIWLDDAKIEANSYLLLEPFMDE